jgi:hypothetical protein
VAQAERAQEAEKFKNRPKATMPEFFNITVAEKEIHYRNETATERREREDDEHREAFEARGGAPTEAEEFAIVGGDGKPKGEVHYRNETASERREREAEELREAFEARGGATEVEEFAIHGGGKPKEIYYRNETATERADREAEELRDAYEARAGAPTEVEEFSTSKNWKPKPQDRKENAPKTLKEVQKDYGRNSRKDTSAVAAEEHEKYIKRTGRGT